MNPSTKHPIEGATANGTELTVLGLAADLLEHSRLIVRMTAAIVAVSLLLVILRPASYTARVSFSAQESSAAISRLGGMAAQLGLGIPAMPASQSPQFYSDFLLSPSALRALVLSEYTFDRRPFAWLPVGEMRRWNGTLAAYLLGRDPETEEDVVRASRKLRKRMNVALARATGVVTLTVRDRSPSLALQVVERGLVELDSLNLSIRQSAAGAERAFAEERTDSARIALGVAEDSLRLFLQQNRSFRDSPELLVSHDRLQRTVALRQQVYVTLAQTLEQSRIDEVRNTPTLTVVEAPILPASDRKRVAFVGMVSVVVGFTFSIIWVLGSIAFRAETSRNPAATQRLASMMSSYWGIRWLARRFGAR